MMCGSLDLDAYLIQLSADVLSASRRKIQPGEGGMERCPEDCNWEKVIIINTAFIMMPMNSWMLMWNSGWDGFCVCHGGRDRKTSLWRRHWKGSDVQ